MLQCESSDELDFGDSEECVRESIIQLNIDESDELFLLAIRRNDVAVTEKMVNQGFPVNKVHKSGWNSLMYACDYGSVDVVALLLKYGADSKTQIGKPLLENNII
jgi:ankyrin repeat protein